MTNSDTKFEVATSDGLGADASTKKIHYLTVDLDIGSRSHENYKQNFERKIAKYFLTHQF